MKQVCYRPARYQRVLSLASAMLLSLLLLACNSSFRPAPVHDRSVAERDRVSADRSDRTPDQYTVFKGDTLYSIAFRYNLDFRDLARWNGIGPPYTIYPGQVLGFTPRSSSYADQSATGLQGRPLRQPSTSQSRPLKTTASQPKPVPAEPPQISSEQASTAPRSTGTINTARRPAATSVAAAGATRNSQGINWIWPVAGGRVNRTFLAAENSRQGVDIGGSPGQPVLAAAAGEVVYSGPGLTGYAELIIIKHNDELLSAYGHNRRRLVKEGETVRSGQQIAELGRSPRGQDELHFQVRRLGKPQNPQDYLPRR